MNIESIKPNELSVNFDLLVHGPIEVNKLVFEEN